jgi:hypothetical protein
MLVLRVFLVSVSLVLSGGNNDLVEQEGGGCIASSCITPSLHGRGQLRYLHSLLTFSAGTY